MIDSRWTKFTGRRVRRPAQGAWILVLAVGLALAWTAPARAQGITYAYDELGRLVGVTDPSQGTAVYNYDSVGNILSIQRYAANAVLIINFAPKSGPTGTTVTIAGTGFSPTPSQNTVTFNGAQATVTSATATQLVVTVPGGATTGTIGVTAPGGSATSSASYTVTSSNGAPTIAGFSPAIGTPGTSVSITGTNFDLIPTNDKTKFNTFRLSPVSASTATSLTTTVPSVVGSGHIRVDTPGGTATSASDFFIPPAPHVAADAQVTGRMTFGGAAQTISLTTPAKIALEVFDGTAGQGFTLTLTSVTITDSDLYIYKPDGSVLIYQPSVPSSSANIKIASLPVTGTYTIMVAPNSTYTGNMTLTLVAPDLQVTSVTQPSSPVSPNSSGAYSLGVGWTIKNNGPSVANPNWIDRVYLSASGVKDANAIPIYSQYRTSSLAATSTYSVSQTAGIYGLSPGTYYLLVGTDDDGVIPETSESNNIMAAASAITFLGLPDLIVTGVTVPSNPIPNQGGGTYSISLSWTVKNVGQSTAIANWRDEAVLNTTASFSGYKFDLGGATHTVSLAPGASYTVNTSLGCYGCTAGTYYVIVKTDNGSAVAEANENNNTLASSTTITLQP